MTAAGIGALCGALFLAVRKGCVASDASSQNRHSPFLWRSFLFSYSIYFWLAFALLIAVGFFMMLTIASVNTTIQSIVPDELRGRVMSFFTTTLIGLAPIGGFVAGGVAKYWGVQNTIRPHRCFVWPARTGSIDRYLHPQRNPPLLLLQQPLLFK